MDAATASQDVQAKTCRQMQRKVKRAVESLKKWPPGFAWVKDKDKLMTLVATAERLHEAVKWIADNAPEMDFAETEAEETVNMQPPESGDAGGSAEIGKYGRLPLPPPPPPNQDADEMTQQRKKRTLMKSDAKWPAPPPPPRVPPR